MVYDLSNEDCDNFSLLFTKMDFILDKLEQKMNVSNNLGMHDYWP